MTVVSSASLSTFDTSAPSMANEGDAGKPREGWLMDNFERELQASMRRSDLMGWPSGKSESQAQPFGESFSSGQPAPAEPRAGHVASDTASDTVRNTTRYANSQTAPNATPNANRRDVLPDITIETRVAAYNKFIAESERFLVDGPDGIVLPINPLAIRAWLFNIGLAYDNPNRVMKETDTPDCRSHKQKVEKVFELFRSNKVLDLLAKVIGLRLSYDSERAMEQAERLVRYAYGKSI